MFKFDAKTNSYSLISNPEKKFRKEFLEDSIMLVQPIRVIEEFVKFCNGDIDKIQFSVDDNAEYLEEDF